MTKALAIPMRATVSRARLAMAALTPVAILLLWSVLAPDPEVVAVNEIPAPMASPAGEEPWVPSVMQFDAAAAPAGPRAADPDDLDPNCASIGYY